VDQAVRHGRSFVKHVLPAVVKPARTLWNEVIGFLFLSFAVIIGFRTARAVAKQEILPVILGVIATALMLYYGISSFWKARKISRS
jgi:hypothetical protein